MTPSGIEPATFRFVAQHLNHCATAVTVMMLAPRPILNLEGREQWRAILGEAKVHQGLQCQKKKKNKNKKKMTISASS